MKHAFPGVSLLEALVALTIIGSAFGAILSLQSQLVMSLDSVQRAHERASWIGNINEIADSLEYDNAKSGRLEIADNLDVRWQAVEGQGWERANRIALRQGGNWTVRLTPIDFEVRKGETVLLKQRRLVVTAEPPPRVAGEQATDMFGTPIAP